MGNHGASRHDAGRWRSGFRLAALLLLVAAAALSVLASGRRPVQTDCKCDPQIVCPDNPPTVIQADSVVERLEALKELRKRGEITEEEYQRKRRKLLDAL